MILGARLPNSTKHKKFDDMPASLAKSCCFRPRAFLITLITVPKSIFAPNIQTRCYRLRCSTNSAIVKTVVRRYLLKLPKRRISREIIACPV